MSDSYRSWKFFVLGRDRSPLPNCSRCASQLPSYESHSAESCTCLTCHGFYAASADLAVLDLMAQLYPTNQWAVRTGSASGIVVLDVEGPSHNPAGYETLENWATFTGFHLPDVTLQAKSPSGGLHLYFAYPGDHQIKSRNMVLPGVDVKANGGYVVIPHVNSPGRTWERDGTPTICTPEMVEWLVGTRGSGAARTSQGRPLSYDFQRFFSEGCPEGARETFFNDLIFRMRVRGVPFDEAVAQARAHWEICEQPPKARWYWAWEHVMYKLRRVYATVKPNEPPEWQTSWAQHQAVARAPQKPQRVGRVTLASRNWKEPS